MNIKSNFPFPLIMKIPAIATKFPTLPLSQGSIFYSLSRSISQPIHLSLNNSPRERSRVQVSLSLKINLPNQSIGLSATAQGRDQMYESHHKERYITSHTSHQSISFMRPNSPTICNGHTGSISPTINKVSQSKT